MVIDGDNKPLFQCRVLYIGSAVPLEKAKGIEAIQQPLRERYQVDDEKSINGVDAVLAVLPSEIQMTYSEDSKTLVCFPISSLIFCAAVRCIHLMNNLGTKVSRFVSLNSPAAGGINARRPAIFAAITRRMKGRKVLECHAFLCATPSDAQNLVHASKMADRVYKSGLGFTGFSSVYGNSLASTLNSRPETDSKVHLIPADQKSTKSEVPKEFFDAPPVHGYFYSAGPDNVKSYTVERVADSLPNGNIPNEARTLDRSSFRSAASMQPNILVPHTMVPLRPQFIRHIAPMSMKKGGPIHVNTLPPPRRFLSPPTQPMSRNASRKDPYIYMQPHIPNYPPYAYRMPFQPRKDRSPSSCQSSGSGETAKANLSPSNSAKSNSKKDDLATNGNEAGSSSDSSRPNTPPRDYEIFTAPDIQKSRLSRREQHEMQKKRSMSPGMVQPMIYPYNPYIYPAYYYPHPVPARPRSLPPPLDSKKSSKSSRKKKDKKAKKKTKGKPVDDPSSDHFGYNSEVPTGTEPFIRSSLDRSRTFQNERAFAYSIAEERKHRSFTQTPTPYGQFDEKDTDFLY